MTDCTREATLEDPETPQTASQESQGRGLDHQRDGFRPYSLEAKHGPAIITGSTPQRYGHGPRNARRELARAGLGVKG